MLSGHTGGGSKLGWKAACHVSLAQYVYHSLNSFMRADGKPVTLDHDYADIVARIHALAK